MATGVLTVGRRQYACGLYWENSPSGRIAQAAKEAAGQPGNMSEYYAARSGNKQGRVPQFGLAPATPDFRPGMPCLAGCLANQQPGSWIGAFHTREGTVVIVVRDDLLVPDGDLFFLDEAEARDHMYQEMAVGGFQRIYAPEAWGVPGADSMPLGLLLNERTDVKLRKVTLSQQSKNTMIVGGALLLIVLGGGWYYQYTQAQEEEALRKKMAAMEKAKARAKSMLPLNQKPDYPPPVRKWEKEPRPLEYINACHQALQKVDVAVAGWSITSMQCRGSSLAIKWDRQGGFSDLPKGAVPNDSVQQASSSVSLEGVSPRGDEKLVDPEVITRRYLSQNWTGTLSREPDDPPPPPPPGYKGEWNPPPPPWVKRSFTFTVPVLPWTMPDFLKDIPGVVVRTMQSQGDGTDVSSSWKIEGVIYENRR